MMGSTISLGTRRSCAAAALIPSKMTLGQEFEPASVGRLSSPVSKQGLNLPLSGQKWLVRSLNH
jgi:hypothetical protein